MDRLQQMIKSTPPGGTVDIGNDIYELTVPLYVADRTVHADGARIISSDSKTFDGQPTIRVRDKASLLGTCTVVGSKPAEKGYTPAREFQHGVLVEGVSCFFSEWDVTDVWGDGYYIGLHRVDVPQGKHRPPLVTYPWSENYWIHGARIARTGRQGITVVAGRHGALSALQIEDTGRSVVDLEPPGANFGVEHFAWTDSHAIGGHGVLLANKGKGNASCHDIIIDNIWAEDRAIDVRCVSLDKRRTGYKVGKLGTNVPVHHAPLTFWGIDGLDISPSQVTIPDWPAGGEIARTNDCTDVTIDGVHQ